MSTDERPPAPEMLDYQTPAAKKPPLLSARLLSRAALVIVAISVLMAVWAAAAEIWLFGHQVYATVWLLLLSFGGMIIIAGLFVYALVRHSNWRLRLWLLACAAWLLIVYIGGAQLLSFQINRGKPAAWCLFHLGELGSTIRGFAQDHGGRFPNDLAELIESGTDFGDLQCNRFNPPPNPAPTTRAIAQHLRSNPSASTYVYRGAGLTSSTVTPQHVIAHDRLGNHGRLGINVLYGDGDVRSLDEDAAKKLLAELDAGHNPPRPPHQ